MKLIIPITFFLLIGSMTSMGQIAGSGTAGYIPKFTTGTAIGNSLIYDNGTNVGIGTNMPTNTLTIAGQNSVLAIAGMAGTSSDLYKVTAGYIGNSRRLNYVDVLFSKNLVGMPEADTYKTVSTYSSAGYSGIEQRFYGDIFFYAGGGSTVADQVINPVVRLAINGVSGNVGIGTTTPAYKLDVNGSLSASQIKYTGSVLSSNANNVWIGQTNLGTEDPLTNSAYFFGINPRMGAERVLVVEARTADGAGAIVFKSGNTGTGATVTGAPERMRLSTYGNLLLGTATDNAADKLQVNGSGSIVGNLYCNSKLYIGTPDANTTTRIANYALAVNGNAIFNKAKVMLYNTPWADYVFDDNYTMLTLPQLDKYIKKNKHLPDMPTTAEVKENGIDLGDNQVKLLQKIEELTLYLIEQNKKIDEFNSKVELQRKQINDLLLEVKNLKESEEK